MKIFSPFSVLLALLSVILLGSCSDDDNDPPKSDQELIGSGVAWKFGSASAGGFPVTSAIPECFLDNTITFNYNQSGNTGVVDAGAIKCDETEPQSGNFVWTYNESTKVLSVDTDLIDIPGASGDIKVVSVNSDNLVLTQSVALSGFGTQEVTLTLVH
ncbi:lipocalin family protein [Algoriphagus sp. AGSA1]|uniref:lipocalin family protein n=1 Tax=Algoriphagus sp. AGSA1 TaxID=2907213 RepID=UPI001F322280|nr:lipocalin family protein [Algoriphagus sp. AGSA1]MCE7056940.1 lipocalin family protein [Algoriphagus sp. AGSA1]